MKKITLSLLLCLICLSGMAQSSKKLDLKDITSGKYRAENIRNVVPMPDGEHYTQMNEEGTQITKYSFKTGEPVEVIFDVTKARECDFTGRGKAAYRNRNNAHLPAFIYSRALFIPLET